MDTLLAIYFLRIVNNVPPVVFAGEFFQLTIKFSLEVDFFIFFKNILTLKLIQNCIVIQKFS